jgi:hypothetical protein
VFRWRLFGILYLLFVVLLLLSAAYGDAQTATATATQAVIDCGSDLYVYNPAGFFVCVPPVGNVSVYWFSVNAYYNWGSNTTEIQIVCLYMSGCAGNVTLSTASSSIASWSFSLGPGGVWDASQPASPDQPYYVFIINATDLSGSFLGTVYAPVVLGQRPLGVVGLAGYGFLIALVISLLVVAPIVSFALQGRGEDAGIALLMLAPLFSMWISMLGVSPVVSTFAGSLAGVLGVLYLASSGAMGVSTGEGLIVSIGRFFFAFGLAGFVASTLIVAVFGVFTATGIPMGSIVSGFARTFAISTVLGGGIAATALAVGRILIPQIAQSIGIAQFLSWTIPAISGIIAVTQQLTELAPLPLPPLFTGLKTFIATFGVFATLYYIAYRLGIIPQA